MVKNKCGFVGVGAYGGNQVRPFYKESYPSLFINTALEKYTVEIKRR